MFNPFELLFQSLAEDTGLPLEQVRFIGLIFLTYPLGFINRHLLHPATTSLTTRYLYGILAGVLIGFLCFGWQMCTLLAMVGVCYVLLKWASPAKVQRYTMVWAMACISIAHIYRMTLDNGHLSVDFTAPFMVLVQKVTLVAYALHDGKARKDSQLNADQKAQKLESCPSLLEYFGYTLNFHTLLAGPSCTYKEYISFIDGSNFRSEEGKVLPRSKEPSSLFAVVSKLFYSLAAVTVFLVLSNIVSTEDCWDPSHNLAQRILIMYLNCFRMRNKYYFAWLLAESINNLTGLGFNGYKDGIAQWNLITNVHVLNIELATSLRGVVSGWNTLTSNWLRRVCYDRVKFSPTLLTFGLSAWWHGFYPGYAFVFIYFAIQTTASRKVRRLFRPYFQTSVEMKWFYDAITFFFTHIFLDYGLIFAIEFLRVDKGLRVWSAYYYLPLVLSVLALLLPAGSSNSVNKSKAAEKKTNSDKESSEGDTHSQTVGEIQ